MLPRPLPAPFDSDEHLFEPWWGGERALVSIGPADAPGDGEVRIRDAAGVDVTAAPARTGRAGRPGRGAARRSSMASWSWSTAPDAPIPRSWRGASRGGVGTSRSPSWPSTCSISTAGRCSRSRSSAGARHCGASSGPGDEVVAVPAIATEGVALFEARRRPGHRGHPRAPAGEPVPARGPQPAVALRSRRAGRCRADRCRRSRPRRLGAAAAPVLALISRLPLDDLIGASAARAMAARPPVRPCAPPPRTPATRVAARTAAHPPRTSGSPRPRRPRWPPRAARSRAATSHGWTAETMIRASITNGLNGGRNDASVTHAPPPPPSATIAVR